jgi:hypothetical protein
MFTMGCICTFQVFLLEKHRKDYLSCTSEITFPFGIGFKSIMLKESRRKEKGFQNI